MDDRAQTFWLDTLKHANRYNGWIFSQIRPYLGQEVLEVGCGSGNFTPLLAQVCAKVVAVDLNQEYVELAQTRLKDYPGVEIVVADALKMQWHTDTVIMLDVLEHIEDDVGMLRHLNSCLKPGGKLLVKVPALNYLYSPMDKAIGHYRRYGKRTLTEALEKAKFSQPFVWYFNMAGIPGWWLNGVLGRTTPPSNQVDLFNKFVPLFRLMEARVKLPIGLSLFAVATKSGD